MKNYSPKALALLLEHILNPVLSRITECRSSRKADAVKDGTSEELPVEHGIFNAFQRIYG